MTENHGSIPPLGIIKPNDLGASTAHANVLGLTNWVTTAALQNRQCPLLRSLLGVKRTWLFAAQMSAYDPKRTSPWAAGASFCRHSNFYVASPKTSPGLRNVLQRIGLSVRHGWGWHMAASDKYRIQAAKFYAQARGATSLSPHLRVQFEELAKAYLRLAEQADRNGMADITYEPPPPKLDNPNRKQ
jgi:hypothetical protein